ncbi:zip zinc transporter family protein, putative, partial [Ichthyophthirius multifiliis]
QHEHIDVKHNNFPWSFFISIISFSLILFIDKVITGGHSHGDHTHGDHSHGQNIECQNKQQSNAICQNEDQDRHIRLSLSKQKKQVDKINKEIEKTDNSKNLKPYILQVAFGIHATLEGLVIGLENDWIKCLIFAAAVLCHKWAEGITVGLLFKKANINLKVATIMIFIQAIMNPIGVGIGWSLSNSGSLVIGIFMSISAGTFIYIATLEVLVEEFSDKRFRFEKFIFFLIAVGFISGLWFLEQKIGYE